MVQLIASDSETEKLLKGSLILEAEKNAHKRTALKLDTAQKLLAKFLEEFEGRWDSDEQCESVEIANDYLIAAIWMRDNCKRTNNRIRQVDEWVKNYLPFRN